MEAATKKRVFAADLSSIERRLVEIERIDRQNALEKGMLLKHVRDNDLTHGQWLRWLDSVNIGDRTAQRYIQAYEQFGDATPASGLSVSSLFELIQLPPEINRTLFIGQSHTVPSTGESKPVSRMTRQEIREVVRSVREAAGLTKQQQTRTHKSSTTPPPKDFDVWEEVERLLCELPAAERAAIERLPLSLVREILSLSAAIRSVVLNVAGELSVLTFAENFEAIKAEANGGKGASAIIRTYKKRPDPQPLSGLFIDPYEILGICVGETEDVIRKKYRDLTRKVHPDTGGSALLFKLVNAAYEEYNSGRFRVG